MNSLSIRAAARADLILLTADMLRPPAANGQANEWMSLPANDRRQLLAAAALPKTTRFAQTTLTSRLRDVYRRAKSTSRDVWTEEYRRLFDGSIACPINQAAYVRRDKGAILGDVAGFYNAFGWQHNGARGERPDHLRCQLEYAALLLAMEARANSRRQRDVASNALSQFARYHMNDWLPSFCWQLCESTRLPLFGAIGTWLMTLWDSLATVYGWPTDQTLEERLEPQTSSENPYECAAHGLVQLGDH